MTEYLDVKIQFKWKLKGKKMIWFEDIPNFDDSFSC